MRIRQLAGLALVLLALAPTQAAAQACCAGASAVSPARLVLHEDALVAVFLGGTYGLASFDGVAHVFVTPRGVAEVGMQEAIAGAVRLFSHAQLSVLIPFVETYRRTGTQSEIGGMLGDATVHARYDFTQAGEWRYLPGLALLTALTLPTGRPVESASKPLATDASGFGAWRGVFGAAAEQTFGSWYVNLTGSVTISSARGAGALRTQLAPELYAFLAGAYSFDNGMSVALTAAYSASLDASLAFARVPDTARTFTRIGVGWALPIADDWRAQLGAFSDLPLPGLGRNMVANLGLTFVLIRSWS